MHLLLDTCALIWLITEQPMRAQAIEGLRLASAERALLVSPVTAWEIGLLATGKRPLRFDPDPRTWFTRVLSRADVREARLDAAISLEAALLPGDMHRDPADRLLIATARGLGVPIVTRDRRILAYADAGHVEALPC